MEQLKIAVIDDEYYFRMSLMKSIEELSLGFEVKIVGDACCGEDGIELIRTTKPDIVMLDINMPMMDGLTVLKLLRAEGIDCHVVIISGYADFEYAKKAIPLNVSQYLLKPLQKSELKSAIVKIVDEIKKRSIDEPDAEDKKTNRSYSPVTNRAIKYIEENLHDSNLLVSTVAEKLNVNYSYLCTVFKKDTESSLNEYIVSRRMEKAKQLFAEGIHKVSSVSRQLGYADPSYFSKTFKQTEGMTPSEYLSKITSTL